ncbi:MAG: glycosyltransferase family 39 protein [Oligoflexales bacterium]|nr:glycosyltransferase family 39 protein [Oligoflexales bacterium]
MEKQTENYYRHIFFIFIGIIILFRIFGAKFLPVTRDEAYYFSWAAFPDLGYFDHPPLIAWLSVLVNAEKHSWFMGRLGCLILSFLMIPISISLFKTVGISGKKSLTSGIILMNFNFLGFMIGILATPDIPFIFSWLIALHEALKALLENEKRWITAGIFTGLGILGKYAMLFIGPIFLFALLMKPEKLKSPWPYLGGIFCVIVITPHLMWNYNRDFISLKFQLGHGFQGSHKVNDSLFPLPFPYPTIAEKGSKEAVLAEYFKTEEEKEKPPEKPKSDIQKSFERVSGFVISQILLWGFLIFPISFALIKWKKQKNHKKIQIKKEAIPLIAASFVFPLIVFGIVSFKSHIEANWPAFYVIGASVLIIGTLELSPKAMYLAAIINLIFTSAVIAYSNNPIMFSNKPNKRIISETYGYDDLGRLLEGISSKPLFGDSYQIVSMLRFYAPDLKISQWPGITRHSEFTRRGEFTVHDLSSLREAGSFSIILSNPVPPKFYEYEIKNLSEIRECLGMAPTMETAFSNHRYDPLCKKPLQKWYLAEYLAY